MAATTIKRIGYGQVEPNHLSAQKTGQIYAQLPAATAITQLENGQFVKYDYANNEVNFTGIGEWMLVFNEVKLYDGFRETYKDFAQVKGNYVDGKIYPRVLKTNVGDIYTTNCVGAAGTKGAEYAGIALDVANLLCVNANGFLVLATQTGGAPATTINNIDSSFDTTVVFQVVKVYTLADGQPAVKVMRIA